MSLLVVGSVAYDTIKTPHGEAPDTLGGAAVYSSLAASVLAPVRLVGVVGDDFAREHVDLLISRGVDVAGLETVAGGKTFRWSGAYSEDMNSRETLSVDLNVFESFEPTLPDGFRDSRFVFLANAPPLTQLSVLDQVGDPTFVMADTMDLWIETAKDDLLRLLGRIDGISLNDAKAMQMTGSNNLIDAGRAILDLGPKTVVIKKGEHGSFLFTGENIVPLPAFPTAAVCDPTGAGDSFAGALMGEIARVDSVDEKSLKRGVVYGSVVASFTCEGVGTHRRVSGSRSEVEDRFSGFCESLAIGNSRATVPETPR